MEIDENGTTKIHSNEIIEIRDSEIDVPSIMTQIRSQMNERAKSGPLVQEIVMAEELWAVRDTIEDLRRKVSAYGNIGSEKKGSSAKLELFVKKVVRKVIRRHIDQQREVHEALLRVVDQLEKFQCQQNIFLMDRIEKVRQAESRK